MGRKVENYKRYEAEAGAPEEGVQASEESYIKIEITRNGDKTSCRSIINRCTMRDISAAIDTLANVMVNEGNGQWKSRGEFFYDLAMRFGMEEFIEDLINDM